jgi:hypothetical protein
MTEGTDETQAIKVEILSITVDSQITACMNQIPIKHPNWVPGIDLNDGPGSQRPGVFEIAEEPDISEIAEFLEKNRELENIEAPETTQEDGKIEKSKIIETCKDLSKELEKTKNDNKKTSILKVAVSVTCPPAKGKITLVGKLGGIIFSGAIDGKGPAKQTVTVVPLVEPVSFTRTRGDMQWYLLLYKDSKLDDCIPLGKTRMEIFWIYGPPGKMFKRGVWIEVLRRLHLECGGLKTRMEVIRRIINYCHTGTGLRYDSFIQACYYSERSSGGVFNLKAWLARTYPFCNCFDQAGAVQVLSGALGIEVEWTRMEPFGYINETSLVGRGQCNNPSFLDSVSSEILPRDDSQRGFFGHHAFCIWQNSGMNIVLDATAGPHLGDNIKKTFTTGNKQAYIDANIDATTGLYDKKQNKKHPSQPGRLKNIKNCQGIIDVHKLPSDPFTVSLTNDEKKKIEEFKKHIDFDNISKDIPNIGVVFNWPPPTNGLVRIYFQG